MAGYPKKGFRDDKGGRTIVDGARWRVGCGGAVQGEGEIGEIGFSASRTRGAGDASGGGGGRWCVWYGEQRALSI